MTADHQETLAIEVMGGDSEGSIALHWATTKVAVSVMPK